MGAQKIGRTIGIGVQDFAKIQMQNLFYVDKTMFIKQWWESGDEVTLITRPRRFGKTLTLHMLEEFFSVDYAQHTELFSHLQIWRERGYQQLQGTYPVINLTFSTVKETSLQNAKRRVKQILADLYGRHRNLLNGNILSDDEKNFFRSVNYDMEDTTATISLHKLSEFLMRYYGRKVIILLDEYDTPMQEAYVHGFWDEFSLFMRSLLNATFKTNPGMERGLMTGITRVSKESIFSDLNNLEVVTTSSDKYADIFGFTAIEVERALAEYQMIDKMEEVRKWYDGFTFGSYTDIYNPWSVINYLDKRKVGLYWANTSSNGLIDRTIRESAPHIKESFEQLLHGKTITIHLDEQLIYNQLDTDENAIWSLLLAAGYLKILHKHAAISATEIWQETFALTITNFEVMVMFRQMVHGWFSLAGASYNSFIQALLQDDVVAMNTYINRLTLSMFSYFDSGKRASAHSEPERFYHGFVLGLLVDLQGRYAITSNRESGFGRYDIMLMPKDNTDAGIIIEFKVYNPATEADLTDTVCTAIRQIQQRRYDRVFIDQGIPSERIRAYGFGFSGKTVRIEKAYGVDIIADD